MRIQLFLLFTLIALIGFVAAHRPRHSKRSATIVYKTKRVCVMERLTGVKHAFCPTSRPNDPIDWPCIRVDDLCNGDPQCPGGEDEDPDMCMFFQAQNFAFQQLRRKVATMLKPYMETKTKTKDDLEFIKN